jgi:predicted dehydrogenase
MRSVTKPRREFLKGLGTLGLGAVALEACGRAGLGGAGITPSASGGHYVGDFVAPRIPTVRCAFIGVGSRGSGHAEQIAEIEGTEIVAISDLYEDLATGVAAQCMEVGGSRHREIALYHGSSDGWRQMLEDVRPDAVFISTPWTLHTQMATTAMHLGAHTFVEVPLAPTIKELWEIVDTSESTGRHCMMMENVNYGREELLFLNMCRQGVIGELLHGEAAYIHDLRRQMRHEERGTGSWRTPHYAERNGNMYPTHGLGPVAQYMSLARGEDNFSRLVSYSSPAKGRSAYAKEHYPPDHKWRKLDFQGGDLNTCLIKTTMGRTIMVQWDETSPRPYTRHNLIQGTTKILAGFPTRVALEGGIEGVTENHHDWAEGEELAQIYDLYEHPLYTRLGELARKMGGHGGMDFIMRYRIIECLRLGQPLDQNLYEGCFWSAVSPLSEASVAQDGAPQLFPNFTRGRWGSTQPLGIVA